jgi:hypothetical protein
VQEHQEPTVSQEKAEGPMGTERSSSGEGLMPSERRLGQFAKYFFFLQLVLIPTTIFLGNLIVGGIDLIAHNFFDMNKVEAETNHFWQALSVSLVASLALCSFRLWRDPRGNIDWALPIIVATASASASFLAFALFYRALSLYLGLVFQLALLLPTLFLWWRAVVAQRNGRDSEEKA